MIGAVMFFLLIGLMFIGVPIAFSMGLSAIIMLLIRSSASVVVVNVYLFHFIFYICSFLRIFRSDHKKPLDILPQSHSGCKQFLLLLFFCKLVQNFI